jgi:nucleoside diphosphate kinase
MTATSRGLTVFGPEVARSGLTDALHQFIAARTELRIADCFVALHTRRSIKAFYQLTGSTGGAHWPLVESLFDLRPVCVTLWSGTDALDRLQKLKGATQPAKAQPGTVRSLFWCDNPVANLIHVSDTTEIMASELRILRGTVVGNDLRGWHAAVAHRFAHSALWTLTAILARQVGQSTRHSGLPANGNAQLSARLLWQRAEHLARQIGQEDAVRDYLAGDEAALAQLLAKAAQVSAWEQMILACGLHSHPVWGRKMTAPAFDEGLARCH